MGEAIATVSIFLGGAGVASAFFGEAAATSGFFDDVEAVSVFFGDAAAGAGVASGFFGEAAATSVFFGEAAAASIFFGSAAAVVSTFFGEADGAAATVSTFFCTTAAGVATGDGAGRAVATSKRLGDSGSIGFPPTAIILESAARLKAGVCFRTDRLGDGADGEIVTPPFVVFDALDVAGFETVTVGPAAGGAGSAFCV